MIAMQNDTARLRSVAVRATGGWARELDGIYQLQQKPNPQGGDELKYFIRYKEVAKQTIANRDDDPDNDINFHKKDYEQDINFSLGKLSQETLN